MKNIHLLPTDKPSRLILQGSEVVLSKYLEINEGFSEFNQHIYITSNEEIKDGDLVFNTFNNFIYKIVSDNSSREILANPNILPLSVINKEHYFKIILTTDQDLIKDGVQCIDDEFLEWFVKNPNCESVDINRDWGYPKIIIPQEEPKQEDDEIIDISDHDGVGNAVDNLNNEPPQETLEEDAEIELGRLAIQNSKKFASKSEVDYTLGFIQGAKWQAERMYSEEEVKDIVEQTIEKFYKHRYSDKTKSEMKELWFEQFKKK
jgi:hypothetical protein